MQKQDFKTLDQAMSTPLPGMERVYLVGAVDGDVRIFHGYEVLQGTTYNAYLVVDDEHAVLIDFVKAKFADQLVESLHAILGDRPLTHIICNHVEPDHSGALPAVLAAYPGTPIYGTGACERELRAYYPEASSASDFTFNVVKKGDSLTVGDFTYDFIPMPMVHWPDSMSTYVPQIKTLFSNDALGQHIGTGVRFDHELRHAVFAERLADYYANIVMPFGLPVTKLLTNLSEYDIATVCPSHGVVLVEEIAYAVAKYADWAAGVVDQTQAVIIFDTMWGTTRKMARVLADELEDEGKSVTLVDLSEQHYSAAMVHVLEATVVAVGSPTLNNQMLPNVAAFLTYMRGLKPHGREGIAFGSYGWSGESIKQVHESLESAGFTMREDRKAMWNI